MEAGRLFYHVSQDNRDFEIQRRGQQRERKKNNRFNKQNNNFARASHFFVHFFPVFVLFRSRFCLISRFMEDVNKQRQNFIFLSQLAYCHLKFSFRRVHLHLQNRAWRHYSWQEESNWQDTVTNESRDHKWYHWNISKCTFSVLIP